jgi:peptidoglycan/LPS O-acetylase OafA/YrhL
MGSQMDIDFSAAYFVLMALVIGLAALPQFRHVDNAANVPARYSSLDGLRGFAALSVVFHHLFINNRFIETGIWATADSRFYALLGPVGVSLFFMITGFLFWGKMLRARGRPSWHELYIHRVFRIAPLYLFVVVVMLVIVFARTGFEFRQSPEVVIKAVLQWLALGMINTQPAVNTYEAKNVLAGVTWTIFYEWLFYASLLATAFFARGRWHLVFIGAAVVLSLIGRKLLHLDVSGFVLLFSCGMAVASLLHEDIKLRLSPRLSSLTALICMALVLISSHNGYGTVTTLILALFFYLVCSGTSVFGLLTSTPATRLGNISYSIYLMQGLVLTMVFSIVPLKNFATTSALNYWTIGMVCLFTLLICATLGYLFIERPGIALGKYLVRRQTSLAIQQ